MSQVAQTTTSRFLDPIAMATLRGALTGGVITPDDPGYDRYAYPPG